TVYDGLRRPPSSAPFPYPTLFRPLPVAELAATLPAGTTARETEPGHYVVTGAVDAGTVAAVTAWCADRGVLPTRLDTDRRSLQRSEENTSELQSRSDPVCPLLPEK